MAIKTQFGDPKDAKFSNEHLDDYYQNWWYLGTINSPANPSLECDFYFDPVRHLTSLVYGPEPGRYETLLIDYDKDTKRVSASKGVYPCPDSYAARVKEHLARINTVWPMGI